MACAGISLFLRCPVYGRLKRDRGRPFNGISQPVSNRIRATASNPIMCQPRPGTNGETTGIASGDVSQLPVAPRLRLRDNFHMERYDMTVKDSMNVVHLRASDPAAHRMRVTATVRPAGPFADAGTHTEVFPTPHDGITRLVA